MEVSLIAIPEGDDLNVATDRTVKLMAHFAKGAVADPEVHRAARHAWLRFARGARSRSAIGAGIFWWLKHCMRFRQDSLTLRLLGLSQNHHDFVTDPRIIVRMQDPAEDCDGFATMGAALCRCLGVPYYFLAAATEADDPERWSHVWLAIDSGNGLNNGLIDLDGSHGEYFGWGVPFNRRYLFGLWNSDGVRVI